MLALLYSPQYLDVARTLEGYGTVVFPHCACDARRNGHVIASVSLSNFRLQACSKEGDKQVSVLYDMSVYIGHIAGLDGGRRGGGTFPFEDASFTSQASFLKSFTFASLMAAVSR